METLTFEPLASPALRSALVVLCAGLLAIYAFWRPAGKLPRRSWTAILVLMGLALIPPLVILLNPVFVRRIPPPAGKPRLTVVIDRSASMATADAEENQTRYQAATRVAQECTARLSDRFEVQVRTFAETVTAVDPAELASRPPDGNLTDMASAINESLGKASPAGQAILLIGDGIHNAASGTKGVFAATRVARAAGTPVYTITVGRESAVSDIAVRMHAPQQLAFVGQKVPVNVLVKRFGAASPRVQVVLSKDGKELARKEAQLSRETETDVQFFVGQEKTGVYRYEAEVEPVAGEVTTVNNFATFLLRVIDEPIRVLLLEGKPYWDGKFLMRTLAADPSIELDCGVQLSPDRLLWRSLKHPRVAEGAPARASAPAAEKEPERAGPPPVKLIEKSEILTDGSSILASAEKLKGYQVVVLGRGADVFLTEAALTNLRNWISRDSGALVCYRGQPMTKITQELDKLLPLRWSATPESRFRMTLTERGRTLRWLPEGDDAPGLGPAGLPSLSSAAAPERLKPLAVVLATAAAPNSQEPRPVVTYQPYGAGRVTVIEGSGMWRWAFLPPKYHDHDEVYRSLWQSLLRWLVSSAGLLPGQKFALRTEKVSFSTQDQAGAMLLMREEVAVPLVELRGDGIDKPRTVKPVAAGDEPGTFRVPFGNLPEGRYEARVIGGGRRFVVQPDRLRRPPFHRRTTRTHGPPRPDGPHFQFDGGGRVETGRLGRNCRAVQTSPGRQPARTNHAPACLGPVVDFDGDYRPVVRHMGGQAAFRIDLTNSFVIAFSILMFDNEHHRDRRAVCLLPLRGITRGRRISLPCPIPS